MDYVVVGAGAIGGTIGARLARDGRDVLLCLWGALTLIALAITKGGGLRRPS
jgi:ketopantoate reductase